MDISQNLPSGKSNAKEETFACENCSISLPGNINPFGSFRHNGSFPESLFDTESISDDSTHIYMNLLDNSAVSRSICGYDDADTQLEDANFELSKANATISEQDSAQYLAEHSSSSIITYCKMHDPINKVSSWLQNCPSTHYAERTLENSLFTRNYLHDLDSTNNVKFSSKKKTSTAAKMKRIQHLLSNTAKEIKFKYLAVL